ncbi:bleomycin resistance protein [Brevibacillus borstelensis]|uniref:VOC family protein n=1 Tax=Brevibacillus borstelensis TaxID=45462 RepID=UPI0030BF4D35
MNIRVLSVVTSKLSDMKKYYSEVLRLPLAEEDSTSFAVKAGSSLLRFSESAEPAFYHYAFAISQPHFEACLQRIKKHQYLLRDRDGEERMTSVTWRGNQIYFEDPEGNILEVLSFEEEAAKGDEGWLRIQEVGMPVPDVPVFAEKLSFLDNEFQAKNDTFRFFGDQRGVFVLVKQGRSWFPTDRPASIHPIRVEAGHSSGERGCPFVMEEQELGYVISTRQGQPA